MRDNDYGRWKMATRKTKTKNGKSTKNQKEETMSKSDFSSFYSELIALAMIAVSIFLFLSNFQLCGTFGNFISALFFGIFGTIQYILPILFMIFSLMLLANHFSRIAVKKVILSSCFVCMISVIIQMLTDSSQSIFSDMFQLGYQSHTGGGLLGGSILYLMRENLGMAGSIILTLLICIATMVLITEKSFFETCKEIYKRGVETTSNPLQLEEETSSQKKQRKQQTVQTVKKKAKEKLLSSKQIKNAVKIEKEDSKKLQEKTKRKPASYQISGMVEQDSSGKRKKTRNAIATAMEENLKKGKNSSKTTRSTNTRKKQSKGEGTYQFPSYELLQKPEDSKKISKRELDVLAMRLQETLQNFGVNVTITNVNCGPTVTRFELQPEQGVKVSKIVSLTDDIKLNLAASDIRIEAPIPGKAAIGIEIPNTVNQIVRLRELLECEDFEKFPSKIGFAAGKDLYGNAVYADIEKMPHLLIAGATGSGKSVCINTIIMSLLYKADPKDVKMILVDPKVVELSVYNGIPHLLVPVVTDPKKATGALNWAVAEMMKRYHSFSEVGVRNIKTYNQKVEKARQEGKVGEDFKKMPQIVIIIDELADLMMVASHEVEDAIVRLTQLARAAGIYLIIATQRPSVNVITGLIKANVPSRIAFSVSSGVDSRTILDSNGAERLLGNGDMLFFPTGYKNPIRVQGGFVSDDEITNVVEFLKKQNLDATYQENNVEISKAIETSALKLTDSNDPNGRDEYFYDAAEFIIDKDRASITSLQRIFKIGFNRAARLMDQLADAGIVGEEEGTKPRKVVMSREQFERLKEEQM